MARQENRYWKKVMGIDLFKINWYAKYYLYHLAGIKLPKIADQRDYWENRGPAYFHDITASNYIEREVFFQDMIIDALRPFDFSSAFEAGCGFGWNIKRVQDEFNQVRVGGLDFSQGQLQNAGKYMEDCRPLLAYGDVCRMPFKDDAFDVGFSLGVFMNLHPRKIEDAVKEMLRVSKKYIIHLEYDENHTTPELREKRAFKRNIVSHDYRRLYEALGGRVIRFLTYQDFGSAYQEHAARIQSELDRWEGFEGPEKYIFILIEV